MRKKILFCILFIFLLVLPLEAASRIYWAATKQASFWAPEAMYLFYPALKKVQDTNIKNDDGFYDILLLGGSVLYDAGKWDQAITVLQDQLKSVTSLPIRLHNVARPSHSSRDSMIKYHFLKNKYFDLVVIYHAINDVRANNCPPEFFREDYAHYSWYRKMNFLEHYTAFKIFTLPYTIYSLSIDIQHKLGLIKLVPTDIPNEEWIEYGKEIKSALSFETNLEEILNTAKHRREQVLLTTFAFHVPRDYTYFKFKTRQLDYTEHTFPIEVWGKAENVIRGILIHNQVIRNLAALHPESLYLDEYPLIPKNKMYFNDICHLTDAGLEKLLNDFSKAVRKD